MVQPFIFSHYPLPGRRLRIPCGPGVHLTGYPPPRRRIRTPSGPAVYLHSLSAARKASPNPEWSSRSSSVAIRCQEGVSGSRAVQPFIFIRYPPLGRRIGTPSGPAVHLHSLSAARKAYPDPTGPGVHLRSSIRLQEGVYGPEGPTVLLNSPIRRSGDAFKSRMIQSFSSARRSATREPYPVRICVQPFVAHPPPGILFRTTRVFQPCTSLAYLASERRIRTARGRGAHLYSPVSPQGDASGLRGHTPSSEDPTGRSTSSPHSFMRCR